MGLFHSKTSKKRSEKQEVTDADKAVLSLKTQRRKLTSERQRLESLIAAGVSQAKAYIRSKRRERALLALRKNKLYEQNLDRIDTYLLNVEEVLSNIENAQRNNRLFSALKEGNGALAQLQKQISLEDVEKLNDETAETKEYQDRLRDLLGMSLSAEEDASALEELEKIQAEQEAEQASKMPKAPTTQQRMSSETDELLELPSAPQHIITQPTQNQPQKQSTHEPLLA